MSRPENAWSVIVHGGARAIDEAGRALFEQGCLQAVRAAATLLAADGSAMDAAEAAIRVLEDLPQFNAGNGSVANSDGEIEMDAAIMDGETLALGGVAAIRDVRNPIGIARALVKEPPTLLAGAGARRFATQIGVPVEAMPPARDQTGGDTVGCVVRDARGHLASGGSTGGIEGKRAGRIGDTPLPGCGLYADDAMGAAALSGDGEAIARGMLAARALHYLAGAPPPDAARHAITFLERTGGEAGIILIDPAGRMGIAHNSPQFSIGLAASWMGEPRAGIHLSDIEEYLS